MGGVVIRAAMTRPEFPLELVSLLITAGAPHKAPLLYPDAGMVSLYSYTNNYWIEKFRSDDNRM